jgi:hypothetical protein
MSSRPDYSSVYALQEPIGARWAGVAPSFRGVLPEPSSPAGDNAVNSVRADLLIVTARSVQPHPVVIAAHGEADPNTSPLQDRLLAHLHTTARD